MKVSLRASPPSVPHTSCRWVPRADGQGINESCPSKLQTLFSAVYEWLTRVTFCGHAVGSVLAENKLSPLGAHHPLILDVEYSVPEEAMSLILGTDWLPTLGIDWSLILSTAWPLILPPKSNPPNPENRLTPNPGQCLILNPHFHLHNPQHRVAQLYIDPPSLWPQTQPLELLWECVCHGVGADWKRKRCQQKPEAMAKREGWSLARQSFDPLCLPCQSLAGPKGAGTLWPRLGITPLPSAFHCCCLAAPGPLPNPHHIHWLHQTAKHEREDDWPRCRAQECTGIISAQMPGALWPVHSQPLPGWGEDPRTQAEWSRRAQSMVPGGPSGLSRWATRAWFLPASHSGASDVPWTGVGVGQRLLGGWCLVHRRLSGSLTMQSWI